MYCDFFGFSEKPFEIAPDPKFLFLGPRYQEALNFLVSGICERLGLIVLTGREGVGKGMLLRAATERLDAKTKVVQMVSNDLPFEYLLAMALVELGLSKPEEDLAGPEALDRLKHYAEKQFANDGNVVFVIKDAQNLDNQAIMNLQRLSDLEIHKRKLIQVVFSGTPELEANLGQLELGTFTNSINLQLRISPLTEDETYEYIHHRLAIANYKGPELFDSSALRMIWEHSGGVPRKVNMLCENALLIGYGNGKKGIEAGIVEEAVKDLSWKPFSGDFETIEAVPIEEDEEEPEDAPRNPRFLLGLAGGLVVALSIVFAVWLFSGDSEVDRRFGESAPVSEKTGAEVTGKSDSVVSSVGPVRKEIEGNGGQETEVATIVEEMTETEVASAMEQIVENQESSEVSSVEKREEPSEDLEALPKGEGEPLTEVVAPALTIEEKPPVAPTETLTVKEKPDEKKKTASAPPPESKPKETSPGKVILQLGAFRDKTSAEDLKRKLTGKGYDAYLEEVKVKDKGILYRVRVRCCSNAAEGRAVKARLKKQGFGDAVIVSRKKT